MNTLVIHPFDRSTEFLTDIYSSINAKVIRQPNLIDKEEMFAEMYWADRIYMLGHGVPQGLLSRYNLIVDEEYVEVLRNKENVYIWCNADVFVKNHKLDGLYTGMFISETSEARIFNVEATLGDIIMSNRRFARAVRETLERKAPSEAAPTLVKAYSGWKPSPVIQYNADRIYGSDPVLELPGATPCPDCGKFHHDRLGQCASQNVGSWLIEQGMGV